MTLRRTAPRLVTSLSARLDAVTGLNVVANVDRTTTSTWTKAVPDPGGYNIYRQAHDSSGVLTGSRTLVGSVSSGVETFDDPFDTLGSGLNEPTGMTLLSERPFDFIGNHDLAISEEGWDDIEDPNYQGGTIAIVSDPTAPESPSNVAQIAYTGGGGSGSSFGLAQLGPNIVHAIDYKKLYHRYYLKVSSNFYGHSTGTNKICFYWTHTDGTGAQFFGRLVGTGAATLYYEMGMQGGWDPDNGRTRLQPSPAFAFERDRWYVIEESFALNTPGMANGVCQVWIDGVLVIDEDDIRLVQDDELAEFYQVQWSPTWGGGVGDIVPATFYMWMDHSYVSAKAS